MIRTFTANDMEQAVGLMARLHHRSQYHRIKPHWPTVVASITRLMMVPTGFVYVAETNGTLHGMLAGMAEEFWWTERQFGARYATDLLFCSDRFGDGKDLMRGFIDWSFSLPRVVRIECAESSGLLPPRVADRFYERMGFTKVGSFYVLEHPKMKGRE